LFEELRLQDAHAEVHRLRAEQRRAEAKKLVARLEVEPKDEAVVALRSVVRAAAGPELKFRAGLEATAGKLSVVTTSEAGLSKKQSKVFDPGGGL
jgi:hypothetical protein